MLLTVWALVGAVFRDRAGRRAVRVTLISANAWRAAARALRSREPAQVVGPLLRDHQLVDALLVASASPRMRDVVVAVLRRHPGGARYADAVHAVLADPACQVPARAALASPDVRSGVGALVASRLSTEQLLSLVDNAEVRQAVSAALQHAAVRSIAVAEIDAHLADHVGSGKARAIIASAQRRQRAMNMLSEATFRQRLRSAVLEHGPLASVWVLVRILLL